MILFCFTKILNLAFYMTRTFDSGGFFTFLVALAHGVAPPAPTPSPPAPATAAPEMETAPKDAFYKCKAD